jgi:hypothetical protein
MKKTTTTNFMPVFTFKRTMQSFNMWARKWFPPKIIDALI